MIVKLNYADVKGTGIKVVTDNKEVTGYMKVVVDRTNIEDAVSKLDRNNRVVAFYFDNTEISSDLAFLSEVYPTKLNTPILYSVDLTSFSPSELNVSYLDSICVQAPASVRLVLKLPSDFTDMATVFNISVKYTNATFCGGNLLRIPGCNIGCIRCSDVKGRVFGFPAPVVHDCGCVMDNIAFDNAEIVFEQGIVKQSSLDAKPSGKKVTAKPKKAVSTLFSLGGNGLSNF